jgi:hypothetical protein
VHCAPAWGGIQSSLCSNLARMEIKLIFNEIADQIPDIAKLDERNGFGPVGLTESRNSASHIGRNHHRRDRNPKLAGPCTWLFKRCARERRHSGGPTAEPSMPSRPRRRG